MGWKEGERRGDKKERKIRISEVWDGEKGREERIKGRGKRRG